MEKTIARLQVITDETVQDRYSHLDLTKLVLAGGAPCVQFREKRTRTTAERITTAACMHAECEQAGQILLVNDRADIALSVGSRAIHLGRNDLDVATSRRILGPEAVIGGTANSLEEARRVWAMDVDYLGVGPVYGTTSKANPAQTMGLDNLAAIAATCPKPVIAIGSITAARIPEVMATGVHGVAVLSFIVASRDVSAATAECIAALG